MSANTDSLPNGTYKFYTIFEGPDGDKLPHLLPFGFREGDAQLYVLEGGSAPAPFTFARDVDGKYSIVTATRVITAEGACVKASADPIAPADKWQVERIESKERNSPINVFKIIAKDSTSEWFVKEDPAAIPAPVKLAKEGVGFWIIPFGAKLPY